MFPIKLLTLCYLLSIAHHIYCCSCLLLASVHPTAIPIPATHPTMQLTVQIEP